MFRPQSAPTKHAMRQLGARSAGRHRAGTLLSYLEGVGASCKAAGRASFMLPRQNGDGAICKAGQEGGADRLCPLFQRQAPSALLKTHCLCPAPASGCRCCHWRVTHHNEDMNKPRDVCDSLGHTRPHLVLTELLIFREEASKPLSERPMLDERLENNE